jgi:hypothetical protein
MARWLRACLATMLLAAAPAAIASFHLFRIEQLYSNADGTVQFVVMRETSGANGEHLWAGHSLTSTGGGTTRTFRFPTNLPSSNTRNRRVLIATAGFAALGLVEPDYLVPNAFLATPAGTLDFAGVDQVSYASLPTDGTSALDRNGVTVANVATNFAGQSASVVVAAAVNLNQHGLSGSWYEPAASGQGFAVEMFPDQTGPGAGTAFVSWFTYDTVAGGAERQRWYTLAGPVASGQPSASLTIYRNVGGNFSAPPVTTAVPVGTATLSFTSCTGGQLAYSFADGTNRSGTIPLTRLTRNVTCSTSAAAPTDGDFALSGNWYDPAHSGQGMTIEVNAASGIVFAAWYTYAPNGAAAGIDGQRWYTAQPAAAFVAGSRSIPVTLYESTGGVFDAPTAPRTVDVGSGTLAFQDCTAATFSYRFTAGSSSGASGTIALQRVGPVPRGCTP